MVSQIEAQSETLPHQARQLLNTEQLAQLNRRSNLRGTVQLVGHLSVMGISGYLWLTPHSTPILLSGIALFIYGVSLATMFAPLHECAHRTAFANQRFNDIVAWWAGVLSFYNSTFYRRYHKWHHRYTQIIGKDPELEDPKPQNLRDYCQQVSGLDWWLGKIKGHYQVATGQFDACPYIATEAQDEVMRSMRWQLVVYLGGAIAAVALGHPLLILTGWLLPLAVGQPVLRLILLAEHTGCSHDANPLTNTRTTLTLLPLRWLMWNLPFHTEHHLYPSIPFHQLPQAHAQLKAHFAHIEPGYFKVNRDIVASF
ncbi:MAG: fatty acid desaturase [Spirulina sp. SIO3F2]|nr:fatty acid desaturase [Spirulina sp. SIO3F2]